MLVQLCPFFLKKVIISGKDWLEMPATAGNNRPGLGTPSRRDMLQATPSKKSAVTNSAQELLMRSPKTVKKEVGGLREVREIIRRELELSE